MAKGMRKGGPKGKKITLKMAKNALRVTPDGKQRLDLSNMGIATFPKCLLKLAVAELDLSRNRLKIIPDFVGQLAGLRWLDLHSNQIERLPESIGQLESLSHLNLCNNRLESAGLPAQIGALRALRSLNLGMNRLATLPPSVAALAGLEEIGLFDNLLAEVPECLRTLPNLSKINTKRNPVASGQGDGEGSEPDLQAEGLYLVREGSLCRPCLEKCKEERLRLRKKWAVGPSQNKSNFSGLMTPNSVAQEIQALWR